MIALLRVTHGSCPAILARECLMARPANRTDLITVTTVYD